MFGLAAVDLIILGLYFVSVLGVGLWMGRREKDTEDFLVGGRKMAWPTVLCSIIATEISAVTFLGVPGVGFSGNLSYLQFGLGSIVARFLIAFLFLSAFYKLRCVTVYEFLANRFGNGTRYTGSLFFVGGRLLASGLRLSIATVGFSVILGTPFPMTLMLFTVAAVIYTSLGGIKAVMWTDVIQALVFIGSGLALLVFLQYQMGWQLIINQAAEADKLTLFRWTPATGNGWRDWLGDPNLFYIAFINGLVMTTAALGTDQDMTQRMLTCSKVRQARISVILSGLIGIPVAAMFLFIGIGLWAYVGHFGVETLPMRGDVPDADRVFPHFIGHILPVGLKGLLLAGVFAAAMSSVDSAMGALSSSAMVDLYKPLVNKHASERHYLMVTRILVLVFAIVLIMLAWALKDAGGFLFLAFKLASIPSSALLGVFLAGLLTRTRGTDQWNVVSMFSGAGFISIMLWLTETDVLQLGWSWLILIGTAITFVLAILPRGPAKSSYP